jgi:hypothetical protein
MVVILDDGDVAVDAAFVNVVGEIVLVSGMHLQCGVGEIHG